jgi:regulatory protein
MKQPGGGGVPREVREKETARIMGRLLRAGFSSATIFKVQHTWGIEVEEFEVEE